MKNCRVCGSNVLPMVTLPNQPMAAQYWGPSREEAKKLGTDLEVVQCSSCGLIQLTNDPVQYYKRTVRSGGGSTSMRERQAGAFIQFRDYFHLEGKDIVEIGEGKGEYLSILNTVGLNAEGLGYYPSDCIDGTQYDGFVCINFLEHAPDPNEFLRGIARQLKAGGVGMISVPDFIDNLYQSAHFAFVADHLLYFTIETLGNTLRMNGFEVYDLFNNDELKVLTAYVKKRKAGLFGLEQAVVTTRNILQEAYEFCRRAGTVAIWGASHHALSLLACQDVAERVSYVIDSSPNKQGKFTPVSGLEIYPPEHLKEDPVDGVLIVAPEYATEISKTIDEKYNIKHVAILNGGVKWLR